MKDLINQILADRLKSAENNIPQLKIGCETLDISEVAPKDLGKFMLENGVPDDAIFCGEDNEYDGWTPWSILLRWDIQIPLDEKDRVEYIKRKFELYIHRDVLRILEMNGYKYLGYDGLKVKKVFGKSSISIFDLFMKSDFENIYKYYSLLFVKVD